MFLLWIQISYSGYMSYEGWYWKNKWFQQINKDITHLKATHYEENYGNADGSVESDADMSVASARSDRSAEKRGWSGLQLCNNQ